MKLRNMTLQELETVLDWAADEGWNPGHEDAEAFFAADPDGFFMAEIDGTPAAAISVVNHSDELAFLGLYICRPEFRGRGIGLALWNHALDHAGDRTIGLDGVPAQQDNYRRSGFEPAGETFRFEGVIPARPDPSVRRALAEDVPALAAMEAGANGFPKHRFHDAWLSPTESRSTFVHLGSDGVDSFATIRTCRRGAKIGPLVAPDTDTAVTLIRAVAAHANGEAVVIDVPGTDVQLMAWCRAAGMDCAFNTARMYRGPAPEPGPATRTVATLELG